MQWSVGVLEFYGHYTLLEAHNRSIRLHRDPPESYGDPVYPPPLDIDRNSPGGMCGLAQRLTALLALAAVLSLHSLAALAGFLDTPQSVSTCSESLYVVSSLPRSEPSLIP